MIYNQVTFKLIMIGDSGTGKSCLLVRFLKDYFAHDYTVTIGVEFATKTLQIDQNYGLKLQIWDTAGQESFRSLVKSFYRNSAAVALVYDITKRSSFESLSEWAIEARQNSPEDTMFILIGTHLDEQQLREVEKDEAEEFMKREGIVLFFQTSAKTAENVNQAFQQLGKQLFINYMHNKSKNKNPQQQSHQIKLQQSDTQNSELKETAGCC